MPCGGENGYIIFARIVDLPALSKPMSNSFAVVPPIIIKEIQQMDYED